MDVGNRNEAPDDTNRGLYKFDLTSMTGGVSTAATQSFWTRADYLNNARDFTIYRVRRAWTEGGATWNTYDGTNNWTTAGCGDTTNDYDSTAWVALNLANLIPNDTEEQWVFGSTGLTELNKFLNGTYTNYGWLMRHTEGGNDLYNFHTSSSSSTSFRPKLVATYTLAGMARVMIF